MASTLLHESSSQFSDATPEEAAAVSLQIWLSRYVAQILNVTAEQIDPDVKFDRHGLDSSAAVGMIGDLGSWLDCELDPALTYDFPTIAALSIELASRAEVRASLLHLQSS